ncbi:hypothetical protein SAY86_002786 [Trapa natans]|uniref:Uncharacterized protein n=1 Tax=Trapa natans TaxID=22666 RepID=A0AAN7LUB6_TRANT|nr:hypothetical protein SAY86_002786 [Trapa natans]
MQNCWRRLREQLSLVGFYLTTDQTIATEQICVDSAEDLSQQVYTAPFVSKVVGRGIAKAKVEAVMKVMGPHLHFYEAVNHEMFHRNQEDVKTTRQLKKIRKRKHSWFWRSIAATTSIGVVALSWTYFQAGKGSSPHGDENN